MLCCFLILASFGSANSVRRDAHSGKAFILFPKTDVENNHKEVTLYKNESTLIAKWTWKNGPVEVNTNPDYAGRIDMDRKKNIWIFAVDVNDTAKYCIKYNKTDKGIEMELNVLGKFKEEEIKNGLDDHPQLIEKYLGNLTDEVGKEITKWLKDHPGFIKNLFDSSCSTSYDIMIIIFVIVTIELVKSLSKHVTEVYKMPKKLWSSRRCSILSIIHHVRTFIDEKAAFMVFILFFMIMILLYDIVKHKRNKNTFTEDEVQEWLSDHPDFMEKHLGISCDTTMVKRQKDTEGTCQPPLNYVIVIVVTVIASQVFIWRAYESEERKMLKICCIQCERRLQKEQERRGEKTLKGQQKLRLRVSDVDKPSLVLKWRFSGRTQDSEDKPSLLDLILNPDYDLIVTDAQNKDLKKFSLEGKLKHRLVFETRPDCLALTDGYNVVITFPQENKLRVVNTKAELFIASVIEFKFHCSGISSMKDGRLIICNRQSRSVFVTSKYGKILQEIKTDSSGKTLFQKPSYVRVIDNRTIYVSDCKTKQFIIIRFKENNNNVIKKYKITDPCTSCVVDGMLYVADSIIRVYTLDGNAAGNLNLDGVQHVRGLAFSEDKRLLIIIHKSDAEETISVYTVMKQSTAG